MYRRHLNWFWQSPEGKLWQVGDGGEGGGDWPEYTIPSGVGTEEPPANEPPANQPPANQPPAAPRAGAPANEPPAPGNGNRGGQPPAQPGARPNLPPYRQEAIDRRDAAAAAAAEEERIGRLVQARLRDMLGGALGLPGTQPPADPRIERLRAQLFEVIPGLKELLDQREGILASARAAPQLSETTQLYWQGVAGRTLNNLYDSIASTLLGAGKTGKDLDPEVCDDVREAFVAWVDRDRTGARVQRYEAQDPTLLAEYLRNFTTRYLDPIRRTAAVNVADRGRARAAQPAPANGGMPPAAQPPAVDNTDEDAVHGRAWAVLKQLREAATAS